MQRAVRRDSFVDQPGQVEGGADFCWALSLRRARWIFLDLHGRFGSTCGGDDFFGAEVGDVQREISDFAFGLRAAFACGPGDYWVDGSGARAVCASIVVLAEPAQHS